MLYLPLVLAMEFTHTHPVPGAGEHHAISNFSDDGSASFAHGPDCIACLVAKNLIAPSCVPDLVTDEGSPFVFAFHTVLIAPFSSPVAGRSPPAFFLS